MKIDLHKKFFSSLEIEYIIEKLKNAENLGFVKKRVENNNYLIASYNGVEDKGITSKWNVKIYSYNLKKKGHSIVCVDMQVLKRIIDEKFTEFTPPELPVLRIDDAGWGFPLCGVMVGITDEFIVKTAVVPVEYFREDGLVNFRTKLYLKKYTELALELLAAFYASPETHRIEICTGFVNQPLREKLRKTGYDVRVVEVKGMLQDELEKLFKEYVLEDIGRDLYYDPKDMKKSEIPKKYYDVVEFGKKYCPEKLKTGWDSMQK